MKRIVGIIGAVALLVGLAGAFWFFRSEGPIKPYDAARDKAFIIDTFKKEWYWLITDYSPNFDVAFMLDNRAPNGRGDMTDAGTLIVKTYVENGKPIGFVMYYPRKFKLGQLLFLGVNSEHRRKGIARKLAQYAIDDMKALGMLGVKMNTRADNTKARTLYESLGFKQIWTDGAYIIYEKIF
jgi:ribosomal protein S18 acetylase RimI-like enzyme